MLNKQFFLYARKDVNVLSYILLGFCYSAGNCFIMVLRMHWSKLCKGISGTVSYCTGWNKKNLKYVEKSMTYMYKYVRKKMSYISMGSVNLQVIVRLCFAYALIQTVQRTSKHRCLLHWITQKNLRYVVKSMTIMHKPWIQSCFFQFDIIINGLVILFRFICIPM